MQGSPFVWKGKTLLSGIDPVRRGERTADAVKISKRTLYFCPSPIYGYGLERLLERLKTEAPDSALLCVEADNELYKLSLKNIDPSFASNQKLRITNICETGALCAFVKNTWGARSFRRLEPVRLTGGWQLYPELYDSLADALRQEIATDWSNALTLTKLGRLYFRNAMKNLAFIPAFPSIERLSFGNDPILVLGAGPSLDEALCCFEKYFGAKLQRPDQRPFRIICVDTCLGALRDRDIIPDLAVILESQHWNLEDFIGCRNWDVPAAMDLSSLPASGNMLCGNKYLFSTPWTELSIFRRLKEADLLPASVPPLGSVGLCAVELARRLSRGEIVTAGIDFSFTLDKYHARCTPGHKSSLKNQTRFRSPLDAAAAFDVAAFSAVSKSSMAVHSNPAMRHYRNLFEQEFSSDSRLFDITGSGLSLGINTLSPEDAAHLLAKGSKDSAQNREGSMGEIEGQEKKVKLLAFIDGEKKRLEELRDILIGEAASEHERLVTLINECDYLWSHFPDYSGGRRPDKQDIVSGCEISFLKRLRMEIDPALSLFEKTRACS